MRFRPRNSRYGLESLALAHCGVGADGARALAAALYCEPSLRHLDLSGNALEGAGTGAPLSRAKLRPDVQANLARPPVTLSLGGGDCEPTGGVAALARALEATSTLTSLEVSEESTRVWLNALRRRAPPQDWERRRALGAEARRPARNVESG